MLLNEASHMWNINQCLCRGAQDLLSDSVNLTSQEAKTMDDTKNYKCLKQMLYSCLFTITVY